MIKILIADDEELERMSLRAIINNKYGDKIELLEAKNGREAINICDLEKPDIVITDIKMPGINGIQAVKKIKSFLPNTYFLILTAYDYFDFAKEAIECRVREYILKPFDREEFLQKIERALKYIQTEREKLKNQMEVEEKICSIGPMLESELSHCIISNNLNVINYMKYMEYLNVNFKKGYSMVVHINEHEDYSEKDNKIKIGDYLKEFMSSKHKVIYNYKAGDCITFFIDCRKDLDDYEITLDSMNTGKDLSYEIRKKFSIPTVIGIGRVYSGVESMHLSYNEACRCVELKQNEADVVHYNDIDKVASVVTEADTKGLHREIFNEVLSYMEKNYNKDISLERISKKFNLSAYYFSRMFKDIFGVNFSEKLTVIRMEKAKEFLKKEDSNIKNICYEVGYNDPNYFSKAFKKYLGMSPSEYKHSS